MNEIKSGDRFGSLVVLEKVHGYGLTPTYWKCKCDCGKVRNFTYGELAYKNPCCSQKCKMKKPKKCARGIENKLYKHGKSPERLYAIWCAMKRRCLSKTHPAFAIYGGRGITICKEWMDYLHFKKWALENGYNEKMTIDRKDPDLGYMPENCQWLTKSEHAKKTNTERKRKNNE